MNNLNNCGCCEGISLETPVRLNNRPGLSAISYRIGNHTQFKESLLASLSIANLKALRDLTSRRDDDFTIALLDAWATVLDVLTFYQERIANESYLGTAIEQLSVLELARLIGYELRPGVAANTYLAFTLDDTSLAEGQAMLTGNIRNKEETSFTLIDSGTRVQSIPGPDEEPQNFETITPLEAKPEWNAMRPIRFQSQLPSISSAKIFVIDGTDSNLKIGDVLLLNDNSNKLLKKILKVQIDQDAKTTWLYLSTGTDAKLKEFSPPTEYTLNGKPDDFPLRTVLNKTTIQSIINKNWSEENLSILIESQTWSYVDLEESIIRHHEDNKLNKDLLFVFRKRAAFFGYNALKEVTYDTSTKLPKRPSLWEEWNLKNDEGDDQVYLDTTYEEILEGSYIAIQDSALSDASIFDVTNVSHRARSEYGLSSKSTRLSISPSPWLDKGNKTVSSLELAVLRNKTIHVQSDSLHLTEIPIEKEVSGNIVRLENFYPGLKKGRPVIMQGERFDLPATHFSELGIIKEVLIVDGRTVLVLDKSLTYPYFRNSFTINANVALATHGESTNEILGDGNARDTFQKFLLKQTPLTFISASTPSGTDSTLEIRVNDLLWKEVPSLFNRGPNEHIYTTRQDDQANTTIIFGDGKTGARLPSGQANISASYRKGIGSGGLVKANQLSQLISKPLGVKTVTNPLKSSGAQDREALSDARKNAKLTIYTLERIVSLQDYEDFCNAFAGISKAMATWVWCDRKRCVHITVAGHQGASIEQEGELYNNLFNAIRQSSIPDVLVMIDSYLPAFFQLSANIKIHPDYITEKVFAAVEDNLRGHYSFDSRSFGQAVTFSEVIAFIQNVEGVIAVDIDEFYRSDESPTLESRLIADRPRPGSEILLPAELLTLDSSPIELKLML